MVQLATRHAEIKDLDYGMARAAGNEPFSADRKKRIYWRECIHRIAKYSGN